MDWRALIRTVGAVAFSGLAAAAPARDGVAESVGDRIVRYYTDEKAGGAALPSFALVTPLVATGAAPAGFPVAPRFSQESGKQVVRVSVEAGTSVYGTGEAAGPLLRNGRRVV